MAKHNGNSGKTGKFANRQMGKKNPLFCRGCRVICFFPSSCGIIRRNWHPSCANAGGLSGFVGPFPSTSLDESSNDCTCSVVCVLCLYDYFLQYTPGQYRCQVDIKCVVGRPQELIRKPSRTPLVGVRQRKFCHDEYFYVPDSQELRYLSCSGVRVSMRIPIACSLRRAISLSSSAGSVYTRGCSSFA